MELPEKICECAFHLGKREVCSSDTILQKLSDFLKDNYDIKASDKKDIINKAKKVTKCETESCVLSQPEIARSIGHSQIKKELEKNFKPDGPALDYRTLLNNFNIDEVLNQFVIAYPGFYHIPFQMIDFAEQAISDKEILETYKDSIDGYNMIKHKRDQNLATVDIVDKYKHGYRTFGVVLNTDFSSGPGKHWFCIFIDLRNIDSDDSVPKSMRNKATNKHGGGYTCSNRKKNAQILYFNSSGNLPLHQVTSWLSDAKMKLMLLDKDVEIVRVATSRLQADDYSCGVWCLYFILSMLNCVSYTDFRPGKVNDDMMYEFRKHFFRHYSV